MKKISHLLLASLFFAALSCDKTPKEEPTPQPVAPTAMTVSASSVNVGVDGETLTVEITAPAKPKFSKDASWITITDGTFSSFKEKITVKVDANPTYEERTGTISLTCSPSSGGTLTASVTIKQSGKEKPKRPTPDGTPGWVMAEKLGFGFNLGNQMDAFANGVADETAWTHVLATEKLFTSLKEKGIKTVRIPVTWLGHFGEAPEYKIDNRLDRVEELVGWAEKAGLNVIINMHHDGSESSYWLDIKKASTDKALRDAISAQVKAMWTQIAERFKDHGDLLIFESFNEINDGQWGWSTDYRSPEGKKRQNDCLHEWNQAFVDAVRATGGNNATRWLGIPGYCADPGFSLESLVLPTDSAEGRLMVGVHYYSPSDFTLNNTTKEWGHTRKTNLSDPNYDEKTMEETFSKMYEKWVAKGIPVYLGEFGCTMKATASEKAFQKYYLEYLAKCASTYGMGGFIWDNCVDDVGRECHGYVHHETGEWMGYAEEVFDVIKKAFYSDDSSYTLETVYDSAPKN
ncbi:MAG: cellulase family glycosylhydrolase [Bacteroidales bacterium]|nr:cellulase family glycosylhydrolase [Bacteroidales bacterium]